MTQAESIKLDRLTYDSERETANYKFSGRRGGKPFSLFGSVPVSTPGDQLESQVREAAKAALAKLLRDIADSL